MEYHFVAGNLVDDPVIHFTTEADTWQNAYNKAIATAIKSSVMDSGDVEFDYKYYESKSILDDFAVIDFPMMSKKKFLEENPEITEEQYFATRLMIQKYLMER